MIRCRLRLPCKVLRSKYCSIATCANQTTNPLLLLLLSYMYRGRGTNIFPSIASSTPSRASAATSTPTSNLSTTHPPKPSSSPTSNSSPPSISCGTFFPSSALSSPRWHRTRPGLKTNAISHTGLVLLQKSKHGGRPRKVSVPVAASIESRGHCRSYHQVGCWIET